MPRDRLKELRHRVYLVLEQGLVGDALSIAVDRALVLLILINLVAVALESVPEIGTRYAAAFVAIEIFSLVVFTVEYGLRLWVAVEHGPHRHLTALRARLKYALSPAGIVDLVAVLPFWFALVLPDDLRLLLVFRIVRFFKIARYSPAMRSLLDVLYRERRALFGCLVITLGTALVAAALMHLAEGKVQPDKLGTIPDALWWAIVTIGTIGYGDVVPITALGKLIATATIFAGLIMMALPIGIIATAFAEQIHRRDFIVTWSMIARVPLFAELDAAAISDIMELLRAQVVGGGRGDRARRRSRPFDVFHRRRRGRGGAQEGTPAARRRPVLRRGGGAAPRPPLGHRHRAHAHEFAGARRAGSARADAAQPARRPAHQGRGGKTRRPRTVSPAGRYRDGGDR